MEAPLDSLSQGLLDFGEWELFSPKPGLMAQYPGYMFIG